jgi:Sec-independent protein translocase protein TatA
MFGFGITEIITLLIVIIVLVNPRDIPALVRKMGRVYGSVMRQMNGIRKNFARFEEEIKTVASFDEDEIFDYKRKPLKREKTSLKHQES